MRVMATIAVAGLAALMAGTVVPAQSLVQPAALKHGRLVVWVVHPATYEPAPTDYGGVARRPPGYKEQTAGSFGQTASEMGTTSSSVGLPSDSPLISRTGSVVNTAAPADRDAAAAAAAGYNEQTSGSFGQTASTFGTEASNHGQRPSTVGQSASNVGTDASNYGQTAGSYGHSLSAIGPGGAPEAPRGVEAIVEPKLRAAYPDLTVQFVGVDSDKLSTMLRTAAASTDMVALYPDVLVFEGFPSSWQGLPESVQRVVKESFGGSAAVKSGPSGAQAARRVVVTMRSRRQATAVAFAEYLQNQGLLKVPPVSAQ